MSDRGIIAKCEQCSGTQCVFTPEHDIESAERLAGLMDGSSPLYVVPVPKDGSSDIGKCGLCGGHFNCKLFGYLDDNKEALT